MIYNFVVIVIENVFLILSGYLECNVLVFEFIFVFILRDIWGKLGGFRFFSSWGMYFFFMVLFFNVGVECGFGGDFICIRRLGFSCMFVENMEVEKLMMNV